MLLANIREILEIIVRLRINTVIMYINSINQFKNNQLKDRVWWKQVSPNRAK